MERISNVDGHAFLSSPNNYGLLLNINWFKPFKHSTYSVGVIFLVVLNLPRSIRFKRENVLLYGIMPGPSEPTLTVNSYLTPLVSDLLDLWSGVLLSINSKSTFRCALLGVSCDLPVGRKTCGLTSYSANFGCSRCYYHFFPGGGKADYGGDFDRSLWRPRSNEQHRSDVEKGSLMFYSNWSINDGDNTRLSLLRSSGSSLLRPCQNVTHRSNAQPIYGHCQTYHIRYSNWKKDFDKGSSYKN